MSEFSTNLYFQYVYEVKVRRCICSLMAAESLVLNFTPMCCICAIYLLILHTIVRKRISANTLVVSTSIIVLTGVLTSIPSLLFQVVKIDMRYEVKNVLLVTVYYVNGIINPLVYFCFNPRVREQIRQTNKRNRRPWRRRPVNNQYPTTLFTNNFSVSQLQW